MAKRRFAALRSAAWADAAVVASIAGVWYAALAGPVRDRMPVCTDTFRDAAHVENILAGRIANDPSLKGLPYWYAPGGPLVYAAASRLTGVEPLELYSRSILWVNVWIPVAFFLLVRWYWDRTTGVLALLLVALCSRWWQTHLTMPMPPIQGAIIFFVSLIIWRAAMRGSRRWAVMLGIVLAACTWHHIVSGIFACVTIGGHAVLAALGSRDEHRFKPLKAACLAGGVCGLLVSPFVWHLMKLPLRNLGPPCYFGGQLYRLEFALCDRTPLFIPVGLAGAVWIARKGNAPQLWVLAYFTLAALGQLLGYLNKWTQWPIPYLLPHEFQWHGHAALGILAAVATVAASRHVASKINNAHFRRVVGLVVPVAAIVAIAAPGWPAAVQGYDAEWLTARCDPDVRDTVDWIRRNTSIDDVFACGYLPAYYEVNARTGRKLILVAELRANPAADVVQRRYDISRLKHTLDPEEFRAIARRYDARFAYVTKVERNLLERWGKWDFMKPVYRSPNGERVILSIDLR